MRISSFNFFRRRSPAPATATDVLNLLQNLSSLAARIEELERNSALRNDRSEQNVGIKIDWIEQSLGLRIDHAEKNIGTKLDWILQFCGGRRDELRAEIDRLDTYISAHFERLESRYQALEEKLHFLVDFCQSLTSISELDGHVRSSFERFESKLTTADERLRYLVDVGQSFKDFPALTKHFRCCLDNLESNLSKIDESLRAALDEKQSIPGLADLDEYIRARIKHLESDMSVADEKLRYLVDVGHSLASLPELNEKMTFLIDLGQSISASRKAYPPISIGQSDYVIIPSHEFDFLVPQSQPGLCAAMARSVIDEIEPGVRNVILSNVKRGQTVVDLGANIGIHCLTMANAVGRSGQVFAFEPTKVVADALVQTTILNGVDGHVAVYQKAVGDHVGTVKFRVTSHSPGNSIFESRLNRGAEIVEVPLTTLDDVIPAGKAVNFIKMDVEGAEPAVWCGMRRVLSESPELRIVLEWSASHFKASGFSAIEFAAQILEDGFEMFEILPQGASSAALSAEQAAVLEEANVYLKKQHRVGG